MGAEGKRMKRHGALYFPLYDPEMREADVDVKSVIVHMLKLDITESNGFLL